MISIWIAVTAVLLVGFLSFIVGLKIGETQETERWHSVLAQQERDREDAELREEMENITKLLKKGKGV